MNLLAELFAAARDAFQWYWQEAVLLALVVFVAGLSVLRWWPA